MKRRQIVHPTAYYLGRACRDNSQSRDAQPYGWMTVDCRCGLLAGTTETWSYPLKTIERSAQHSLRPQQINLLIRCWKI